MLDELPWHHLSGSRAIKLKNKWKKIPSLKVKCSALVTFKDIVQYMKLKVRS